MGFSEKITSVMRTSPPTDDEEHQHPKPKNENDSSSPSDEEGFSKDAQIGVRKVEASAMVWTKGWLIAVYAFIWLIYVVTSLEEVVVRTLTPFVTSSLGQHSLTATMSVASSIIGGLVKLPLAKVLDTWGRPQGLSFMLLLWILGFILMAVCRNVATYAAAQVFATVGAQGVSYCLTVFTSDTSSLRNRSLMLSFATSPYIFTTWAGAPLAQAVLNQTGWRWGLGLWAIVIPCVVGPLCVIFFWNEHKARRQGVIEDTTVSIRDITPAAVWKYIIEVDLFGIIILAAGMALFLLPFNIYSMQSEGWKSPMIIAMIIVGGLLIIFFAFYERYLAPVTFIPFHLLLDRSVFFGGTMFVFVFFNSAVWGSYFSSMLLVVWDVGVEKAAYIGNIYRTGSCFSALVLGVLIRLSGRYKPFALFFLMPLMMLGVGLLIHFRQPGQDIGYIIMTQIFIAFAGGPIVVCGEMAMMSRANHQYIAVIIAVLDLFCSIGSALGGTVSAAIWTGTFRKAIERNVPDTVDVSKVYNDLYAQLAFPVGSPERIGISKAYAESQRIMLITSLCLLAGALASIAMWKNVDLKKVKQTRGNVI